jgi:hypothetical protein
MSTLKLKSVTTIAAACALALVSTATFAGRGGTPAPASTTRVSAPAKPTTTATTTAVKPTTTSPSTSTHATGQPGADCESLGNQPGHSMTAPGSAFNPDGVSGKVYAGEQPQNSKNPTSVSQYDVACARSH